MISPSKTSPDPGIETLIRAGLAELGGDTLRCSRRPRRIEGRPGARIVIEERR